MTISYDAGTNTITVKDLNAGAAWTINDIYLADVAGGWNRCHKQGAIQYYFSNGVRLVIGHGTIATAFGDTNKQIVISELAGSGWQTFMDVMDNVTLRFGTIVSGKTTKDGCAFYHHPSTTFLRLVEGNNHNGTKDFFNCYFQVAVTSLSNCKNLKMYDCNVNGDLRIVNCTDIDVSHYLINSCYTVCQGSKGAYSDLVVQNNTGYIIHTGSATSNFTFENVYGRGVNKVARGYSTSISIYMINFDVDVWGFTYYNYTGKFYRQYKKDVKVIEEDSLRTAIAGATVKIWDLGDNLITNTTTDVNGNIVQQTLNFGYYNQAHGDTPVMQTPHKIEIKKPGYETFVKYMYIDYKRKEVIMLRKTRPVKLCDDRLVLQVCPETEKDDRFIYTELV